MSKKLAVLISTLITAVSGASVAFVSYFEPSLMTPINSAIDIAAGAAITIIGLFSKKDVL